MSQLSVRKAYPYIYTIGEAVADLVSSGKTLHQVAGHNGIPPLWCLLEWLEQEPEFKTLYDRARRGRSEVWLGRLVSTTEQSEQLAEESGDLKPAMDNYKWLLERDGGVDWAPPKQKVESTHKEERVISIFTGVLRPGDPGYDQMNAQYTKVLEAMGHNSPQLTEGQIAPLKELPPLPEPPPADITAGAAPLMENADASTKPST